MNVKELGQVFTPCFTVTNMINLIKNSGNILEPSAGDGAFALKLNNITAIEKDPIYAKKNNFLNIDFFQYSISNKFDTIIGNPPYVRYQDILNSTKELLKNSSNEIDYSIFDNRSNLYLFFIYKSIFHLKERGELIFITPRDFLKATSAIKLNKFIYEKGTITNIIELGDKKIFKNASPNTVIWRFEKDNFSRTTNTKQKFIYNLGQLLFTQKKYNIKFNEIFFVKVGAVSGADKIFEHKEGKEFVCSYTNKTGKTKKLLYTYHKDLEKHKEVLINRKIRNFNEKNWYEWGRKYYKTDEKRVYVNGKTRDKNPFFTSNIKAYDGSILAIFPKKNLNIEEICKDLNLVDWQELGFVVDGRFIFSQKSLENTILPSNFKKYL